MSAEQMGHMVAHWIHYLLFVDVSMHSHITALNKSCVGCYNRFYSLCSCFLEPDQLDSAQEANSTVSF